jgi:hypothetical protein
LDHRSNSQDLDTKPWFRQFWPWFVILLPASAVVASLYTVNLAIQTSDSLVVDAELGMDVIAAQHVAAGKLAASLGLSADLELNRETGALSLSIRSSHEQHNADVPQSVVLTFSHPAFEDRDQSVVLQRTGTSHGSPYSARLPAIPDGRWYLVLESGGRWRMTADLDQDAQSVSFNSGSPANGEHGE